MATWYIDPVNGNSSYSGDSWTLTLSGTDGVSYGTTKFTSASGGFTGKAGRYIRIVSQVYRIEAVVSDTEVTLSSTISSGSGRSFWIGGAVAAAGNLPYSTLMSYGDKVRWAKTGGWSAAGTLTYASKSDQVTMGAGRIAMVCDCESAWTASTNVTGSLDSGATYHLFGSYSVKFVIGSSFTTGKVAYYDFGAGNELNLSSFQGISLLAFITGTWNASSIRIALCSDATGDTVVDSIPLYDSAAIAPGGFCSLQGMKSGGGNLGSSIRSIALYADADPGTPTIYLDNIVAIKSYSDSDHICHNCLIGQGNTINDLMWAVLGFYDATTIRLVGQWYGGTAGAVSSYRVEPAIWRSTPLSLAYSSTTNVYGGEIINTGGWNTTTNTQDGVTCWRLLPTSTSYKSAFSYPSYGGVAIVNFIFPQYLSVGANLDYVRLEDCGFTGTINSTDVGLIFSSSTTANESRLYTTIRDVWMTAMYSAGLSVLNAGILGTYGDSTTYFVLENVTCYSTRGWQLEDIRYLSGKNIKFCNNTMSGGYPCIYVYQSVANNWEIVDFELKDNDLSSTYPALTFKLCVGTVRIWNLTASGNAKTFGISNVDVSLYNPNISDTTVYENLQAWGRFAKFKDGGSSTTHSIAVAEGTITSETTVRHTASGVAWKFSPTIADQRPIKHRLAEIAVESGVTVTIGVYMRRDNTGINGRIVVPGGRLSGMTTDYTASITANADIWELVTVSFTPTETGVVDLWVEAWGGTTYNLYVDDLSVVV